MAARIRPAAVKPEFEVAACDQKDNSALLKKQHNIRFLPRQGKPDKKTEHCKICLDDVDSDLMFYVERCGHRWSMARPNCPHHGCIFHLSIDRCGDLLTFKERSVWMQRIKENSIPLAERVYCPYESCSHLMSMTELSRRGSYSGFGRCFKCHGDLCVHCGVPWHFNLSCNDYRRLFPNKYREDAKLKSLASLNGWRQCPKCYHMVGRSYGCSRIICRCGNAFCYKCGYLWNSEEIMAAAGKPEFEVATRDQKDKSALLKKQHNLRFLPRQGKPDKKTEHCIICLDDVDSDLMFYVERCGHRFCINCVKQHINVKLVDGKVPNCPHHGCVFHLSIDRCGDVLTFRERLVWMQRIKENSLPLAERVYCPYESCSHLMSKTELSRSGSYSGFRRCFKCRGGFCVHCRVPWHGKLSCNDYRRLYPNKFREDGVDAKLKSLASLCGWRQCPKCYHMVGRSYGCNRITCRCGNAFCYKCGYLWNRGIHGDCNQDEVISDFIFCQFLFLL
ncbi:hypothetical protein IGI04_005452 [Brassica rapa subsp. trilocularis]|uniref:RBR-type E3 ubiquitin transferase n=1 Tax=Brassica rapa subsp. trilocularis TaxID=1813537 RepID=A0ABQ7NE16_BRACM|nr:hypothetical protein IGI04_005452 [Brassica rapa subsp. trilocularis]